MRDPLPRPGGKALTKFSPIPGTVGRGLVPPPPSAARLLNGSCPNSAATHQAHGGGLCRNRRDLLVEYVLNNPVRSGLVERWGDYRCSGSSLFGLAAAGGGQAPALQRKFN